MLAPQIDPVALQIGPLAVHWYGLMYVIGFFLTWQLTKKQLVEQGAWNVSVKPEQYEGLFTALILGVILGGRLAYILFYNLDAYIEHPLDVFKVWQGGMSFHGGMIGPIIAGWWYCNRHNMPFMLLMDRFFVVAPLGLAFGRIGNFINGELWGRVIPAGSDIPWAMVFPAAGPEPRHPSQLYEMLLEGVLLFLILWFSRKKIWPQGMRVAIFLTGYAIARIFCENFRQPDEQLGFLFGPVTMGMLLSSGMLLVGVGWIIVLLRKRA